MSRMSRLRSMTLTSSSPSSARCWAGDSSSSAIRRLNPEVEPGLSVRGREFLGLALADVPVGIDVASVLPFGSDDLCPCGRGQIRQLGQGILGRPAIVAARVDGNEKCVFYGGCEIDEVA